mmetsp:Transcript_7794/g.25584  ORF Transcript_7794/g.25584 Transcript_7794/m.25584 type:complete len:568 (+) Transcript_7794:182-1885(+)|eukprot:CAMPEP_0118917464 /NCGR_PEP_ID=MMETSP1166-20130328/17339_1 /TAXON_ID=1104430 /ORGANISM="Chrysoreinhardia sp, Strain CCMP3193" /LENGTH=567 /DNA_ID=CAMNT_0006857643 /DNA_START=134 /DNA_END=1840 /DNA_ORIENTATION=-
MASYFYDRSGQAPAVSSSSSQAAAPSRQQPDRDKFLNEKREMNAQQCETFSAWLLRNGSKFADRVELRAYDDEVRGVHATRDIGGEEIVVEIPLKCLITVEMGKETDVGKAVLEADLELDAPKHVFLMLFLLTDKKRGDASFFKPYYDMLPATLRNMPVFWTDEELAKLDGSYLRCQVEERKRAIANDYEAICGVFPSFREIATLAEFQWARMCVCSRNFGVVVNGVRTSALVPYADMLNHLRPRETKWTYDNQRGAFTITALQSLHCGQQIYDSYGQKCNHRFLLNYGFAVEDNREPDGFCPNEVSVSIALKERDPLAPRKQLLWIRDGAVGAKRLRICASDNDNFRAVLSLLRVAVADDDDLERVLGQNPYGSYRTASDVHFPVSFKNEVRTLRELRALAADLLAKYPTTLDDDKAALATNNDQLPPFSNARHATIHVKSEKEVLHHYLAFAKTALDLAKVPLGDKFDAKLAALFDDGTHFKHVASYCNSVLRQVKRLAGQTNTGGGHLADDLQAWLDHSNEEDDTVVPDQNYPPDLTNGTPNGTNTRREDNGNPVVDLKAPTIV